MKNWLEKAIFALKYTLPILAKSLVEQYLIRGIYDMQYPSENEKAILDLAYGRFFDLYDEFIGERFWKLSPEIRLMKIKNCFEIYNELVKYFPIKQYIKYLERVRPTEEAFIAEEYFNFLRNVLSHFPFFQSWDDVYITKDIVVWDNPKNSSILKFINKYNNLETVKYRIWSNMTKKYTYMDINFPKSNMDKIFLKDLVSEKEGLFFCIVLMKKVLDSQIDPN